MRLIGFAHSGLRRTSTSIIVRWPQRTDYFDLPCYIEESPAVAAVPPDPRIGTAAEPIPHDEHVWENEGGFCA